MTSCLEVTPAVDGPMCEPGCALGRGMINRADVCPTEAVLKASFPEQDKKCGGCGVCAHVERGSGSQGGDKVRAGCNQM